MLNHWHYSRRSEIAIWGYQDCFLLQISNLCTNLNFLSQLVLVCKMSCKYLSLIVWLRCLIAYLLISRVPKVLLVSSGQLALHRLSFCLALPIFLLYIFFFSNYKSTPLIPQLLLFPYTIKFLATYLTEYSWLELYFLAPE